ncbi:MAG: hypothetical protein J6W27_02415 [Alphaproteobacteria bacterium]|nr:hypothetical protein [Alphaproteobacteria bacterium]
MTDKKPSKKQRQNEMQLDVFEVAFEDHKKKLTTEYKQHIYYLDLEEQALSESSGNWMEDIEDRNDRNNQRFNDDDIESRRQKYKKEYEQKVQKLKADIIPEQIQKR